MNVPHQQVDFKNIDIKPVANLTPNHPNVNGNHASPMQSNSRPSSTTSSIPCQVSNGTNGFLTNGINGMNTIGLLEVKREVIDTNFEHLNASDLTDFLHYPGNGNNAATSAPSANFCLDSMLGSNPGNDFTKDISFDVLMDDCPLLSDDFNNEENLQKLLDELGTGSPPSNQMHQQMMVNGVPSNVGLTRCNNMNGNSALNTANNHINTNNSSSQQLINSPNSTHMSSLGANSNRVMANSTHAAHATHPFTSSNNNSRPGATNVNMNGISGPFHGNPIAHQNQNNQIQSSPQSSPLLPPPVRHSAASTLQFIATRTTASTSPSPFDLRYLQPKQQELLRYQLNWYMRNYAGNQVGGQCNNINNNIQQ
jgi:hypothetical protein